VKKALIDRSNFHIVSQERGARGCFFDVMRGLNADVLNDISLFIWIHVEMLPSKFSSRDPIEDIHAVKVSR